MKEKSQTVGARPNDGEGRLRLGVASLQDGDQGAGQLIAPVRGLAHPLRLVDQVRLQGGGRLRAGPDGDLLITCDQAGAG